MLNMHGRFLVAGILAVSFSSVLQGSDVEVVVGLTDPNPGKAEPGELNTPFAVEFDASGAMIIPEYNGGRLMKWSASEGVTVLAGNEELGYANGTGKDARFNKLHNVAIGPDGLVYLSDHLNHAIRLYDPKTKMVSSFAGNGKLGFDGEQGTIQTARFERPICVSFDADGQQMLVADINNRRIRQIDLASGAVKTVAGNGKRGVPQDGQLATEQPFVDPRAAAFAPDGSWYLVERSGHALRHVKDGRVTTVAGTGKGGHRDGPALEAQFKGPKHLQVIEDGRVVIADDENNLIRIYDPQTATVSTVDTAPYVLSRPHGVKVVAGTLYIADSFHHRVLKMPLPSRE
ncbi:NHL repeat protein [Roseimaritima multifibrata]|uniref:NHL repeat protein n=1 Tax=Roseimaritima multifibrata TaxID=1930274 RepID=A0A517MN29_9BACT|nr:hypothetical protein [Roseimaritima multifibrata]QDS96289.1 NHL repeat protein [Roseimaritima multifibrata]